MPHCVNHHSSADPAACGQRRRSTTADHCRAKRLRYLARPSVAVRRTLRRSAAAYAIYSIGGRLRYNPIGRSAGGLPMHCIPLHCIALHSIALHCIALHCIPLHCIALHCIAHRTALSAVAKRGGPFVSAAGPPQSASVAYLGGCILHGERCALAAVLVETHRHQLHEQRSALQRVVLRCSTVYCVAARCSAFRRVAACRPKLWCVLLSHAIYSCTVTIVHSPLSGTLRCILCCCRVPAALAKTSPTAAAATHCSLPRPSLASRALRPTLQKPARQSARRAPPPPPPRLRLAGSERRRRRAAAARRRPGRPCEILQSRALQAYSRRHIVQSAPQWREPSVRCGAVRAVRAVG